MIHYQAFDQKYPLKARFSRGWNAVTSGVSKVFLVILSVFLFLVFAPVALLMFLPILLFIFGVGQASGTAALMMVPVLMIFLFIPGAILYGIISKGKRSLQIEQFCKDNNFSLQPVQNAGDKTGSLFKRGDSRLISNQISGADGDTKFSIYDYQYATGSGKSRSIHHFGVAEITLKRKFPHILVDNKRDGSISGFEFDKSQKLELEGDFNTYFSVYGPKEYEIEVLQVLNPSVMVSLLSMHESFDIEIIGDKLYIYNHGMSAKKRTFQAIFNAIEQLSTSTRGVQTSFTMPAQIGDNKPLLKRSIWPTVISVVVFLLYLLLQIIPSLLD